MSRKDKKILEKKPNYEHGWKPRFFAIIKWFLLIFFFVYALVPLIWLFMSSLKTNSELMGNPFSLPAVAQWGNYYNAITLSGIGRMMVNSVVIAVTATLLNVLFSCMLAYPLSRFKFKGREFVFLLFSAGILVPLNAMMVPYFVIVSKLGMYNSMLGLIVVYTAIGIPMSTFIIRGFMGSISVEIEEAAYIDGCGFYGRFFYIIFPLSRTGIVTAATFHFLTCWNEFVYAMLLTSNQNIRTVQIGIRYFTNQFSTDYVSMYAAIIVSIVPSILGYMLFQEQIVSGLTSGAVKG